MITKIDKLADLWNKTKDPKYKDEWYKLIKEWAHGNKKETWRENRRIHVNKILR
jgi:hypothetical protein